MTWLRNLYARIAAHIKARFEAHAPVRDWGDMNEGDRDE